MPLHAQQPESHRRHPLRRPRLSSSLQTLGGKEPFHGKAKENENSANPSASLSAKANLSAKEKENSADLMADPSESLSAKTDLKAAANMVENTILRTTGGRTTTPMASTASTS